MRKLIPAALIFLCACGEEPEELSLDRLRIDSAHQVSATEIATTDTNSVFLSDTAGNVSEKKAPDVKSPSGVYQFVYPLNKQTKILHTVAFYPQRFLLQEEFLNKADSLLVARGTWAPSQGFIWLYKDQVVRGRYTWKGDSLQYYSPTQKKAYSLTKLTPANSNSVWKQKQTNGASLYGVGTEPFWSIEITREDSIIFSRPDWSKPLAFTVSSRNQTPDSTVFISASDSFKVVVYPYLCNDGMSDFIYTNRLSIQYRGQKLRGCGELF